MTTEDLSPQEAARWALRAGLPVEPGRLDVIAATANHIQHVLRPLRDLDLSDAAPAATRPTLTHPSSRTPGEEQADALAV
ncbi:hypothetical protein HEK616_75870 (plasmid) [Streptomyces nigrescens]|uniref:Amidase n=2 Tax=Streptomyces TaxID=1883 RepID=A0ABM8A5Y3_STRNI|nr:hypothetical protein [Streptomyces nigrescens]MEE4419175.1 hypothetical protein [Streptomyces sp. DSM 41528]BDM74100.1 hypothetical protein HEK616_75870 [Streptomyces nigrescens]